MYEIFAYILLNIVRVVVAIIPGEPVELLGGILFGVFLGTTLSLIGVIFGSIAVLFLVKRYGDKLFFLKWKKIQKWKWLKNKKKSELFIFLLFLTPCTPKDILTYLVPLYIDINKPRFILLISLARLPSILTSSIAGASIMNGNFAVAVIIYVVIAIVGIITLMFRRKEV
ncbi:MAG: VTT domain-containing protein [Ruminococcus sp.]|jgi:uncharacterized membrane protein YdjX (TVP38/TMEM64 family)|nr:VTT domain-containing protein [Ruminococcus sp.]